MQPQPSFELARHVQAACAGARAFLGPHKARKCVIDAGSESHNTLVGNVQSFLLAASGHPTATTLLLEAVDGQVAQGSSQAGSPGSGATWLAVFCGLLLGHMLDAVKHEGVPHEGMREGVLLAVSECCKAVHECSVELHLVADEYDTDLELLPYSRSVSACTIDGAVAAGPPEDAAAQTHAASADELRSAAWTAAAAAAPPAAQSVALQPSSGAVSVAAALVASAPGLAASQFTPAQAPHRTGEQRPHPVQQRATLRAQAAAADDDDFGWFADDAPVAAAAGAPPTAMPPTQPANGAAPRAWGNGLASRPPQPPEGVRGAQEQDVFGSLTAMSSSAGSSSSSSSSGLSDEGSSNSRHGDLPTQASSAVAHGGVSSRPGHGRQTGSPAVAHALANGAASGAGHGAGRSAAPAGLEAGAVEESELLEMEDAAAWFFREGELQAERDARAQQRDLARLGTRLAALLGEASAEAQGRRAAGGNGVAEEPRSSEGMGVPLVARQAARTGRVPASAQSAPLAPAPDHPSGPSALRRKPAPPGPRAGQEGLRAVAHVAAAVGSGGGGGLRGGAAEDGVPHVPVPAAVGAAAACVLDPLARLVCAAAVGLEHGRPHEMRLAAAAVLLLLRPLVRPAISGTDRSAAFAACVGRATAALQFERCVLTVELLARSAEGASGVLRGVCVPLASLSAEQAALVARFATAASDPTLPRGFASPAPPAAAAATSPAGAVRAVFLHGALNAIDPAATAQVITDAAALAAAGPETRAAAAAARLLAALTPHGVRLLLASGHVPDAVAAAVQDLSGGAVLAVGGVGLRAVRAAAAAAGVLPAASVALLSGRCVAGAVHLELVEGGLGLGDYRASGARRVRRGGEAGAWRHTQPDVLIRVVPAVQPAASAPPPCGGAPAAPGCVTALLANRVASEVGEQAAAFQACFCRLTAVLRSGRVLPGGGAWEQAAAAQLAQAASRLLETRARGAGAEAAAADATTAPSEPTAAHDAEQGEADGLYRAVSYKAVSAALVDLAATVLYNGGAYGSVYGAAAAAAECVHAYRRGDATWLRRVAAGAEPAGVSGQREHELQVCSADGGGPCGCAELRQLAASLCMLMKLRSGLNPSRGCRAVGGRGSGPGQGLRVAQVPLVLDDPAAREAGLRAACRLALLASAVDCVIVNR